MARPEPEHDASVAKRWKRVAFISLGLTLGVVYGYGISTASGIGEWGTGVVMIVLGGIIAFWGYRILDEPSYSTLQRVLVLVLAPFAFVGSLFGGVVMIVALAVLYPWFSARRVMADRKFRAQMEAADRYTTSNELAPLFEAGEGTLIEESFGTGPFRIWYTQENVLAKGQPISSDEELLAVLSRRVCHVYNARCLQEYLDPDSGTALLTDIRPRQVQSGRVQKDFPRLQIVRLVRPPGPFSEVDAPAREE